MEVFRPRRTARKITVFGSARTLHDDPSYHLAEAIAKEAVEAGFEVMTGAGGGVMEGANSGAGCEHSIGLNVDLPFEQHPNAYVSECEGRLLYFRYFFTRKLFFLRESDALVVMPGGFGTLDELSEALTLMQTGKGKPMPIVLVGTRFWSGLLEWMRTTLVAEGMIGADDIDMMRIVDDSDSVVSAIFDFYEARGFAQTASEREQLLYL